MTWQCSDMAGVSEELPCGASYRVPSCAATWLAAALTIVANAQDQGTAEREPGPFAP